MFSQFCPKKHPKATQQNADKTPFPKFLYNEPKYHIYRPQTKLREGYVYVFTGVCDFVNRGLVPAPSGGGVGAWSRGVPGLGGVPVWGMPGPRGGLVGRPTRDGYCCGRYASSLNAFLFYSKSLNV